MTLIYFEEKNAKFLELSPTNLVNRLDCDKKELKKLIVLLNNKYSRIE